MEEAVLKSEFTETCSEWSDYLVHALVSMVRTF